VITEQEQVGIDDLATRSRNGDRTAFAELVRVFQPYVVGMVRKQSGWSHSDLEDIAQAAWEGVLDAVERYEPDKGKFVTFAHHRMRMHVSTWMANNAGSVTLPYAAWRLARKIDDHLSETRQGLHEVDDDKLEEIVGTYAPFAERIMAARSAGYDIQPGDRAFDPDDADADRDEALLQLVAAIRGLPETRRRAEAYRFCEDWGLDAGIVERIVETTAESEETNDVSDSD
jgi:RNA polymerase sigma factor (sigma-70 family)